MSARALLSAAVVAIMACLLGLLWLGGQDVRAQQIERLPYEYTAKLTYQIRNVSGEPTPATSDIIVRFTTAQLNLLRGVDGDVDDAELRFTTGDYSERLAARRVSQDAQVETWRITIPRIAAADVLIVNIYGYDSGATADNGDPVRTGEGANLVHHGGTGLDLSAETLGDSFVVAVDTELLGDGKNLALEFDGDFVSFNGQAGDAGSVGWTCCANLGLSVGTSAQNSNETQLLRLDYNHFSTQTTFPSWISLREFGDIYPDPDYRQGQRGISQFVNVAPGGASVVYASASHAGGVPLGTTIARSGNNWVLNAPGGTPLLTFSNSALTVNDLPQSVVNAQFLRLDIFTQDGAAHGITLANASNGDLVSWVNGADVSYYTVNRLADSNYTWGTSRFASGASIGYDSMATVTSIRLRAYDNTGNATLVRQLNQGFSGTGCTTVGQPPCAVPNTRPVDYRLTATLQLSRIYTTSGAPVSGFEFSPQVIHRYLPNNYPGDDRAIVNNQRLFYQGPNGDQPAVGPGHIGILPLYDNAQYMYITVQLTNLEQQFARVRSVRLTLNGETLSGFDFTQHIQATSVPGAAAGQIVRTYTSNLGTIGATLLGMRQGVAANVVLPTEDYRIDYISHLPSDVEVVLPSLDSFQLGQVSFFGGDIFAFSVPQIFIIGAVDSYITALPGENVFWWVVIVSVLTVVLFVVVYRVTGSTITAVTMLPLVSGVSLALGVLPIFMALLMFIVSLGLYLVRFPSVRGRGAP